MRAPRRPAQPGQVEVRLPDGQGEAKVNQAQQSPVGVRQGPHQPARFVGDVQICADFEAVQRFEHQTQGSKNRQRPPAEPQVAIDERVFGSGARFRCGQGRRILTDRNPAPGWSDPRKTQEKRGIPGIRSIDTRPVKGAVCSTPFFRWGRVRHSENARPMMRECTCQQTSRAGALAIAAAGILLLPAIAGAQTPAAGAQPTFTKDVAPILQRSCVTCHRPGEMAPMSLMTYEDARPWARVDQDARHRARDAAVAHRQDPSASSRSRTIRR